MNDYYASKAEDSTKQSVYLIWLVLIAVALAPWYCTFKWVTHKCPEPMPYPPLPSLIDIQRRVGAKPDGIYGSETETLWDTAYANQEANQFYTPSGGRE